MSEKRQILEVTYGTFSCRLEGFDDSIATMKQVVEYFHDQAALAGSTQIATQNSDIDELKKLTGDSSDSPVEAAVLDGKINLRRAEGKAAEQGHPPLHMPPPVIADQTTEADDADMAAADSDAQDVATSDADTGVEQPVATDEDSDAQNAALAETAPEGAENVATKLQRIRDVVGQEAMPPQTQSTDTDTDTDTDTEMTQPRGDVNPLSQRLAAIAQRNADQAAREAGVTSDAGDDAFVLQEDLDDLAALDGATGDEVTDQDDLPADDIEEPDNEDDLNLANIVQDDDLNLKDELAAVERQIDDRNKRQELASTTDAAISRILMQTDTHLNAPETRRQRDSIAQLKAAVAATEAARQLGDDGGPRERLSAIFRHDLGEIAAEESTRPKFVSDDDDDFDDVFEHRADSVETEVKSSLPPLRLVASQRVPSPVKPDSAASLRLRQIASKIEPDAAQPVSFEVFAKQHDVADITEMFEAAAAYAIFVKKHADFSRPQIMGLVKSAMKSHFSRKNGLQAFGQLINQERIIKLGNGRFQVAPDTRFRIDSQQASG